jgi:hypothetical protein
MILNISYSLIVLICFIEIILKSRLLKNSEMVGFFIFFEICVWIGVLFISSVLYFAAKAIKKEQQKKGGAPVIFIDKILAIVAKVSAYLIIGVAGWMLIDLLIFRSIL